MVGSSLTLEAPANCHHSSPTCFSQPLKSPVCSALLPQPCFPRQKRSPGELKVKQMPHRCLLTFGTGLHGISLGTGSRCSHHTQCLPLTYGLQHFCPTRQSLVIQKLLHLFSDSASSYSVKIIGVSLC